MTTAFQSDAFQTDAFQIDSGGSGCTPAFQQGAFQSNAFQVCPGDGVCDMAFQIDAFQTDAFQVCSVPQTTPATGGDGKRRTRRYRNADEELSREEVEYIRRKLRALKKAKEDARANAERELAEALAAATHSDEAAETIQATIEEKLGPSIDWSAVGRDTALLTQIVNELALLARAMERERLELQDEDDIEMLLLLH